MAKRLDMLIFGASGFTGKHVIPVIHRLSKAKNLTWGVSGRSREKLKEALRSYQNEIGPIEDIPIEIADVRNFGSLQQMASRTRAVLNCIGPYRFYGEPIVRACIDQGTHMVDISGEPQYMEEMQVKYHAEAKKHGVYIVSSCGIDSIPVDLGVVFLQNRFGGTLNAVETYLTSELDGPEPEGPLGNYATWESLVHGMAHSDELRGLRKRLLTDVPELKPKLKSKNVHRFKEVTGWCVPFPGADKSVVQRSQHFFHKELAKRPVQIQTYFTVQSLFTLLKLGAGGLVLQLLCRSTFGRNLLLKNPGLFSAGLFSRTLQPPEEKINRIWFNIFLYGEGWKSEEDVSVTSPNRVILGKVRGRNPAYGATCTMLVLSAITILTEGHKLPPDGGVYPPGAAFANTSLVDELQQNGITFEILYQKDKVSAKL